MEKRKEQCKSELSKREAGEEGFRECILPKCYNKIRKSDKERNKGKILRRRRCRHIRLDRSPVKKAESGRDSDNGGRLYLDKQGEDKGRKYDKLQQGSVA